MFEKVFEMVEKMSEAEFMAFRALYDAWGESLTEEELEAEVAERYELTLEEYLAYFDED